MGRLHVLIVRHTSFDFAPQRDAAFHAKAQSLRPIENRVRARLDSDLIEPRVARFSECLDKIQRTTIRLFPVVKDGVADLERRHAVEFFVRSNRAGSPTPRSRRQP